MKILNESRYQSLDYKEWVTLPPKISIPYNQSYLHLFSLKFQSIQYLNTNLPINFQKSQKSSSQHIQNSNKEAKNTHGFAIKTYWWGQQSGFQSLIKTLKTPLKNQQTQSQGQKEIIIKNSSKKEKLIFEPIKFLVCCPLSNFLKYCIDMRVLKMELISSELKVVIAKTYINFSTLDNCWQGQAIELTLPLFSPNSSADSFSSKNLKIIGEAKVQIKIKKIQNPYRIIPQSLPSTRKQEVYSNGQKLNGNEYKQMKKNIVSLSNAMNANNHYQRRDENQKSLDYLNSSSEVQRYKITGQQGVEIQKKQLQDQKFIPKLMNNDAEVKSYRRATKAESRRQMNIEDLIPAYEKISIPRRNFDSEKVHLKEDFSMIFGIRNPIYDSFFPKQTTSSKQESLQNIEFKVQVSQNIEKVKNCKDFSFQWLKVTIPLPQEPNKKQKTNEYILSQKQGIVKLQFSITDLTATVIQKFIKEAQLKVELKYSKSSKPQNQLPNKGAKKATSQPQNQELPTLKGSLSLLTLLSNCGLPNRLSLLSVDKRNQPMFNCFITALPAQKHINEDRSQEKESFTKDQRNKQAEISKMKIRNDYVWLKVVKFIPLKNSFYRNANIFVKVNLVFIQKVNEQRMGQKLISQDSVKVIQIAKTDTVWSQFSGGNELFAQFQSQIFTFPLQVKSLEQEVFLRLQVCNKQEKTIKIGQCLVAVNRKELSEKQLRGRMQIEVKDIRLETVGYLQCWFEQGDINYINSLANVHAYKRQDKNDVVKKQFLKSEKRNQLKRNQVNDQQEQSNNQSSSSQYDLHQQTSSYGELESSVSSQPNIVKETQNQIEQSWRKLSQKITQSNDLPSINNQLFLQIIVAANVQNQDPFQKLRRKHLKKGEIQLRLKDFISFILETLGFNQQKYLSQQLITKIKKQCEDNQTHWIRQIFNLYSNKRNNNLYSDQPINTHQTQMNFKSFQQSFEAYNTYYRQIIAQNDNLFEKFIQVLNSTSIEIGQLEDDLTQEVEILGGRDNKFVQLRKKCQNKIIGRILRNIRINPKAQLQIETIVVNFFSLFSQQFSNLTSNNSSPKQKAKQLIAKICNQLRKFQLYDTTFQSRVQVEEFRMFISKSISEILEIDHYINSTHLLQLVKINQIQLTKWEILNLNSDNKAKPKPQSNQKVIVKSPTFGILQQIHTNPKSNQKDSLNQQDNQRDKLFYTSPVEYNPSFLKEIQRNRPQALQISEVSQMQERREGDNSYILKRRIEMISPIGNNAEISGQLALAVDPSSMMFSNPLNNSSYQKKRNGSHINQSSNFDNSQNYKSKQSVNDNLLAKFSNMQRRAKWVKVGRNTYFSQQSQSNLLKKEETQNISYPVQNYQANQTLLTNPNLSKQPEKEQEQEEIQNQTINQNYQISQISQNNTIHQNNTTSQNNKSFSKNKNQNSFSPPTLINLFGLQRKDQYNLVLAIEGQKTKNEQIFVNCQHGLQEQLIDQTGKYIGSLMVCLSSQIQ